MKTLRFRVQLLLLSGLLLASAASGAERSADIAAAVDDSHRPTEQREVDVGRHPQELLAFAGVKPGDRVADFMPGNAYFTRLFSKLVGPSGRVYAYIPTEEVKNCPAAEIAGSHAVSQDPVYVNVKLLTGAVNEFSVPEPLDVLWTAQNYHDLHDKFMGPADLKLVNIAFFNAVKPGGSFIVIDHVAAAGSGLAVTESLHRIDPVTMRQEIEAAGFVFDAQSTVLANPQDDHSRSVFDPAVRGRTDQVVLKFRKPRQGELKSTT
jgi:predicted methyltransferase